MALDRRRLVMSLLGTRLRRLRYEQMTGRLDPKGQHELAILELAAKARIVEVPPALPRSPRLRQLSQEARRLRQVNARLVERGRRRRRGDVPEPA